LSKKTVETIIDSKNNYFIQVKGNQKKLHQKIQKTFEKEITLQHNSQGVACKKERNKGRKEMRICYKTRFTDESWKGLKTVVLIQTIVQEKVRDKLTNKVRIKESFSHSYFISSQEEKAQYYLDLKRKHWSIEVFHYTKDITYKEDSTRCGKGKSPQNNSFLRALVICIYKSIGSKNQAQSIRLFGNKIKELYKMIQEFR
jgi:predicted transposase YbfD/YdcC